jgi:hypothetical protein
MGADERIVGGRVAFDGKGRWGVALDRMARSAIPPGGGLGQLISVRRGVTVGAGGELQAARGPIGAVALPARDRGVATTQRIPRAIVIESCGGHPFPVGGSVATLAARAEPSLMRVLMTVGAGGEPQSAPTVPARASLRGVGERGRGGRRFLASRRCSLHGRVALLARYLAMASVQGKSRAGVIEWPRLAPVCGTMTGGAVCAEPRLVRIRVAGGASGSQPEEGPLEVDSAGLEPGRIGQTLGPMAAAAGEAGVAPLQLPAGARVIESLAAAVAPPDERVVAPLMLNVALLAALVADA